MSASPPPPHDGGRPDPVGGATAPGAGGAGVPTALAAAVGPSGYVLATDLDPSWLTAGDGYEVRRHDVAADPPPEPGTFDLVHARLVLVHVPDRARALATMAAALHGLPGRWPQWGSTSARSIALSTAVGRWTVLQETGDAVLSYPAIDLLSSDVPRAASCSVNGALDSDPAYAVDGRPPFWITEPISACRTCEAVPLAAPSPSQVVIGSTERFT